jgi:hypothetical protein
VNGIKLSSTPANLGDWMKLDTKACVYTMM